MAVSSAIEAALATALRAVGQSGEAVALLRQNLDIQERTQGPTDPRTVSTRSQLAQTLERAGRADEGQALLRHDPPRRDSPRHSHRHDQHRHDPHRR
jgi:hypothetical protein